MRLEPHHLGIDVSDLDTSLAFYEKLGFERLRVFSAEGGLSIAFMRLGALQLELFAYDRPLPARASGRCLGLRHLALSTDDIERDMRDLKAAGLVREDAETRDLPNGMRLLFFPDPDGTEIEILQQPAS